MKYIYIFFVVLVFISCKNEQKEEKADSANFDSKEKTLEQKQFLYPDLYFGKLQKVNIENEKHKYSDKELTFLDVANIINEFRETSSFLKRQKFYINFAKYDHWLRFVFETCRYQCDLCYAACKLGMEKKFSGMYEKYSKNPFWIITIDRMEYSPASGMIKEHLPRMFVDGKDGTIFLISDDIFQISKLSDYDVLMMTFDGEKVTDEIRLYHYSLVGYEDKVEELLEKGVSPNWTEFGRTCKYALDCAKRNCNFKVVKILKEYGAKETSPDDAMEHCYLEYWEKTNQ
jgi:hypothetical protein